MNDISRAQKGASNSRAQKGASNENVVAYKDLHHPDLDSQALQEIIEILKYPFLTSCKVCKGLGFIRSGQDCLTCKGSGRVLDNAL